MPGELGNEDESQSVGYYEHRYSPGGEWADPSYGAVESWKGAVTPHATELLNKIQDRYWKKVQDAQSK